MENGEPKPDGFFFLSSTFCDRINKDFDTKLEGYLKGGKSSVLGRYQKVKHGKTKKGKWTVKALDSYDSNWRAAQDTLNLIVENTNYQPEYLRSIYMIEFYRILHHVERKLRK